jgi:hypothetical protein
VDQPAPGAPRRFAAPDGAAWEARLLEAGRPSPYLAPRLARPLVEFLRLAPPRRRSYAPLSGASLEALDEAGLLALWRRARPG